jgi:pyrimidine-nucleoside phosphorylase
MNAAHIIARKRDGHVLRPDEIEFFIAGFAAGRVPDYQMAALAMAILHRGMEHAETASLTHAMLNSGRVMSWPPDAHPTGDKHSTGGVGDKVSLVLAPLLASAGVTVPMISGRGLGPTGGTLDKLESIAGFRTDLTLDEFQRCAVEVGCVISGATADLAPADRKLYALRDVTGTVPSIPLITASILSKKLAAGLDALVLDVKWGSGAFMKTQELARQLAKSLVGVGREAGMRISAVVSDMNQPLGRMVGNSLEVEESLRALRGGGPGDLIELTLVLGAELLQLLRLVPTEAAGRALLSERLAAGLAYEKFEQMASWQGGDLTAPRPLAPEGTICADSEGWIAAIDTERLGQLIIDLGGGRRVQEDMIDPSVGLEIMIRLGDRVERGQPLGRLFAHSASAEAGRQAFRSAITIGDTPVTPSLLIVDRIRRP